MGDIKVSVIVPIYNVEPYLEECLLSLEKQTLTGIEVILVNDGSTDDSGVIARKYAEKNENFSLIERANGGLSAARNTGLDKASGEYVYFLDADDYLLDNTLQILYTKAKQGRLDVLKFVAYTFTEPFREFSWTSEGGYKYKGDYPGIYKGLDALQMFIDNDDASYPSCCLIFTKRETIEKNNLRFYEGIIHEDILFHWELLALSERVAILNEPLYCRRYRAGSITQASDRMKRIASLCVSAEAAEEFISLYPQVEGKTTSWYVMFFIHWMRGNWEQMSKKQQNSAESKNYFQRVKPIAKKYKNGGSISSKIFFINVGVYRIFRCTIKTVKKALHKA